VQSGSFHSRTAREKDDNPQRGETEKKMKGTKKGKLKAIVNLWKTSLYNEKGVRGGALRKTDRGVKAGERGGKLREKNTPRVIRKFSDGCAG